METRTAERRATDKELTHLRRLELIIRNYITHFDDEVIQERFAPRTREMVKDAKEICKDVDELRNPRTGTKPAA